MYERQRVAARLQSVMINFGVAFAFLTTSAGALYAGSWQTVYQTDFTSNPAWITSDATKYYWDSQRLQYHFRNDAPEPYAYIPISYSPQNSYKLDFDILLSRCDWAANISFGLWDADMVTDQETALYVRYHNVDQGSTASALYWDAEGNNYHPGAAQPAPFSLNTWYHNEEIYDRDAHTITMTVTNRDTGTVVGTQTLTGVGTFSTIGRLGFSNMGYPGPVAEGYIDNVTLYTPEPATLTLLAMGGAAALARRKRRR